VQLAFFLPVNNKDSEVSQFLMKKVELSLLPPAEICDCLRLEFLSNLPNDSLRLEFLSNLPNDRRLEQFSDYLLENYIDADSTLPLLFDPNVLHHHR